MKTGVNKELAKSLAELDVSNVNVIDYWGMTNVN
mgnify:CR=1 FL=1